MPRGGARPGAGRKPKTELEKALTGNPGHRGRVLTHPSAPTTDSVPVVDQFEPTGLTKAELLIWQALAPFAFANGTLTRATEMAFGVLCRNMVIERTLAKGREKGGANHRGMIQRVDAELLRFNLAPCGKPMYRTADVPTAQAPPTNPLNRFLKRTHGA